MSEATRKPASPLGIIFLTVFIDLLGIGVIIPVIPALFFEESASFFPPEVSTDTRSLLYGLLIAMYPMLQFFGAPMLGALSDRYGRRPVLSISLVGTLIGYLLFAWAILNNNLWLLFVSRALPGFTGGNISIILSSIADVSDAQSRAKNFGLVGVSFGLGFILGPTIGGILADKSVVSWFNAATPFWFTSILTLLNILLVHFRFQETIRERRNSAINILTGFRNIGMAFRLPNLRAIFTVILLLSLGFTFFTQFFSVLLIQKFSFTEKNIGFIFGWIGIWLVITQGIIVRQLSKKFAPATLLTYSVFALSIALALLLLPDRSAWFYLLNPLIAIAQGITAPNLTAVVSEQATASQQGEILGINQSMQSLGQVVPPLIAGYLNTIDGRLPILTAAVLTLAGWLVYLFVFRTQARRQEDPAS